MKKWLLILIIVLIIAATFIIFALQYDFGHNVYQEVKDFAIPNSIPTPPPLPE